MRRSRGLTDTRKKQASNLCNSSPSALTDTKPLAAGRADIGDRRKRGGKTVLAKGPSTGDVTWELDRLYGYA
jgi:hypothetical protein